MIFNVKYDKSLWLILESDKGNRRKITNFVKSLPNDFYQLLYAKLEKYKEYENGRVCVLDCDDNFWLSDSILGHDGCKYSFVIDMIDNSLTITKSILNGRSYRKIFELTLNAKTTYNNVDSFGRQKLGNVKGNDLDVDYELISTLLGKFVEYSDDVVFKKYKMVNVNGIPEDINIKDLSGRDGFVRVRKMN